MNQMPFNFPNMQSGIPYQNMMPFDNNSFVEQRLQTLEQKVQNIENNIKTLEKKLGNSTIDDDYFKYQNSMHMM